MDLAAPRWPGVPEGQGHYESFYLKAARAGSGVWIRSTAFKRPGEAPVGNAWITAFTPDGVMASKARLDAPAGEPLLMAGAAPDAEWSLRYHGDAPPFAYLPRPRLYDLPLPRTKPVALRPRVTVTGEVTVRGRTLRLDGWPGMVGHNWGREHAERWIWLHGDGLADLVAARVKVGPATTPWVVNGTVRGRRVGGMRPMPVEDRHDGVRIPALDLELTVPRGTAVAWTYSDPEGGSHDVIHSSVADLTVGRERVRGAATYELGMREQTHGVPLQPFPDP